MEKIINESLQYLGRAISLLKLFLGLILSGLSYILFPHKAFEPALIAVGLAMMLDIVTKWYAICRTSGGYKKAVKSKKLYSKSMWNGTRVKLFSYLVISILAGLSYRVIFLEQAGIVLATQVYCMLFLRESQSCIENLMEAGAELGWLQVIVKEKQKSITNINKTNKKGE